MYNQLYQYFENILFLSQCGFQKGYNMQHYLLVLIEKFKEAMVQAIISELLRLIFQKHFIVLITLYWLENYTGIDFHVYLLSIYSPSNSTHHTKIQKCFVNRLKTKCGIPQGSI